MILVKQYCLQYVISLDLEVNSTVFLIDCIGLMALHKIKNHFFGLTQSEIPSLSSSGQNVGSGGFV